MKSKLILMSICLLFFTNAFSQETYYYIKGEKHYLTNISTKRIFVGFADGLSIYEKNDIIKGVNDVVNSFSKKGDIIKKLEDDKQQSSEDNYIFNLANNSEKDDVVLLVNMLRNNDNVKYANYYYYTNKDGGTMHTFYDKVLVYLKPSTTEQDLVDLSHKYDFLLIGKRPYTNNHYELKVTRKTKLNAAELSCVLWETGLFFNAQPAIQSIIVSNSEQKNNPKFGVSDPLYINQWGLKPNYMDVQNAWDYTKGSSNIKIAILDVGVDLDHEDLSANILKDEQGNIIGYDCFNQGNIPAGSNDSIDHHGTECAGCAAAKGDNSIGIAGVAFNCKIIPVRIARSIDENSNALQISWLDAADALRWAALNYKTQADVVSISIGMSDGTIDEDFKAACDDVNYSGRNYNGLPIIVAAGNSDDIYHNIDFPANISSTIAVGAINTDKQRADFSDYGIYLDLVAPGTNIYTTDIDDIYTDSSPVDGTSFSAPYIAGVFALMYSLNPDLSYSYAKDYLLSNCHIPTNYISHEHEYGLWNLEVGYGIPNVKEILQKISDDNGNAGNIEWTYKYPIDVDWNMNGYLDQEYAPCKNGEDILIKPDVNGMINNNDFNYDYIGFNVNNVSEKWKDKDIPFWVDASLCRDISVFSNKKTCWFHQYFMSLMKVDDNNNQISNEYSGWILDQFLPWALSENVGDAILEIKLDQEKLNQLGIVLGTGKYKFKIATNVGGNWIEKSRYFYNWENNSITFKDETLNQNITYVYGDFIRFLPNTIISAGSYRIMPDCNDFLKENKNISEENSFKEEIKQIKSTTYLIKCPENKNAANIEKNLGISQEFKILPNPFGQIFEIFFSNDIKASRFDVLNISGKVVYSKNVTGNIRERVDVKTLPDGIYFVRIYTDKGVLFKKIIKQ